MLSIDEVEVSQPKGEGMTESNSDKNEIRLMQQQILLLEWKLVEDETESRLDHHSTPFYAITTAVYILDVIIPYP